MGIYSKYLGRKEGQSLRFKIAIVYFVIILLVSWLSVTVYKRVHTSMQERTIGEESFASLHSVEAAIISVIGKANNYSKIMIDEDTIQEQLKSGNIYENLQKQKQMGKNIQHLIQFDDDISSVYLIDNSKHVFSTGNIELGTVHINSFDEVSWYDKVINKKGGYILANQGGSLKMQKSVNQYVSLIRLVKNMNDFSNIGIIIVNINSVVFRNLCAKSIDINTEEMILTDENNNLICKDGLELLNEKKLNDYLQKLDIEAGKEFSIINELSGNRYLISGETMKGNKWKILRVVMMEKSSGIEELYMLGTFFLIFNGIILFVSTLTISRTITEPIKQLLVGMSHIDKGSFIEISKKAQIMEFQWLFDGYNKMLLRIQELLKQTVEEQRLIRKVELNQIQAQIKPHFLYNTLDTITVLALMGENDKVCEIIEALGGFYRKSVSKGRDILSIKDELEVSSEYIKIMKIRFQELFEERFEVDPETLDYLVPKLTLQPLVENAINHGLRGKGHNGLLRISIGIEDDFLYIKVADNGVGIEPRILEEIEKEDLNYKERSFGLRGTLDRIKLIYNENAKFEITSKENEYTEIAIYILKSVLERK
ncbi:MAG: histidine kinase [Anaerocolumna sp.]